MHLAGSGFSVSHQLETDAMAYRLKPSAPTPSSAPGPRPGDPSKGQPVRQRAPGRLVSLDAFRGFIMVMLAASGFGIHALSQTPDESPLWKILDQGAVQRIAFQFQHPPWQSSFVFGSHDARVGSPWQRFGVSFWDLIQPAFMFMVGVAMPFSYARRESLGQAATTRTIHALFRAVILTLMGVFLYSLRSSATNWIFTNVLAQIGLGYFFAYLLLGKPAWAQWGALVAILVGTWIGIHIYEPQNYSPEKVNAHYDMGEIYADPYLQWSKNGNAFHDFDVWFLNKLPRPNNEKFEFNSGGYQTLNFVPSIGTTLLGILCGQLLLSHYPNSKKLTYLLVGAIICWGLGTVAGASCCPIVKRIWTPAWVLFSGGYVMAMLALFFLLFDVLPLRRLAFPLVVVGMNSIAIYMMGQMLRPWILSKIVKTHFGWAIEAGLGALAVRFDLLGKLGTDATGAGAAMYDAFGPVVDATSAFFVMWLILYWMYRQRFFVRV